MITGKSNLPTLSNTWITDKHIDLEYKSYVILAYLKHVADFFGSHKIYPALADLINHFKELLVLKEETEKYESRIGQLTGIDWEKLRLLYEKDLTEDVLLDEILRVIDFAIPRFAESIRQGKELYEELEKLIQIEGVGVIPLRQDEGYVILEDQSDKKNKVYQYHIKLLEKPGERFKAVHTSFITEYPINLVYHFRQIKQELIKNRPDFPNPAVFGATSVCPLPFEETFLPLVRRALTFRVKLVHSTG